MESVLFDGKAVEFIHNPALEGTQLSRQGNDLVAVMLPEPATAGKKIDLEFNYGGEVLAEAGAGFFMSANEEPGIQIAAWRWQTSTWS